jgi:hypothetical protein
MPSISNAGVLPFSDDFEDGSATDGSPGTWVPGAAPRGTRHVVNGDYVVSHTGLLSSYVEESDTLVGDISIRTQLRILETNSSAFAYVFARSPDAAAYFGGINSNGELAIGETTSSGGITTHIRNFFTGIDPQTTDVLLQFDIIGNELSLRAWAEGSPKPVSPQLVSHDNTLTSGSFGVFMFTDSQSSVAYRWFEAVPEPSSAILVLGSLFGLISLRRE